MDMKAVFDRYQIITEVYIFLIKPVISFFFLRENKN